MIHTDSGPILGSEICFYDALVINGLERCRNQNCLRPLIGTEEMICDVCVERENEAWREAKRQERIDEVEWCDERAWGKPVLRAYYGLPAEGSD